jgi:23S rRNA (pseudouridine1915-N3)-methyltransferase
MVFHVVAVGRIRDSNLRAVCDEYAQRTRRYTKLEIREVAEGTRGRPSAETTRRREAEALMRAIPDDSKVVALTRQGTAPASRDFAVRLGRWREQALNVAFVVGGAHGLDESVIARSEEQLSLSPMTLPHEVARLLLLEQIYRGHTILRGEPYHKGG